MGNNEFRLSINVKTVIIILLLLNVGYAYKKINQYKQIADIGFIRERTEQEQIRNRIMKSFGSVEEMERIVADFAKLKEDAEVLETTISKQDKRISKVKKELEDVKSKNRDERVYLHKKIRGMADGFSKRKDQYGQMGKLKGVLKDAKSKYETENACLQKKISDLEELISKCNNQ